MRLVCPAVEVERGLLHIAQASRQRATSLGGVLCELLELSANSFDVLGQVGYQLDILWKMLFLMLSAGSSISICCYYRGLDLTAPVSVLQIAYLSLAFLNLVTQD